MTSDQPALDLAQLLEPVRLPPRAGAPEQVHLFTRSQMLAINTALAGQRALLVRGEPGTGKTQLALAAAIRLGRAFVSFTVDSRTEARDLLWHFDTVSRLAEAQLQGAGTERSAGEPAARRRLAIRNFVQPRLLWWAFDWHGAAAQAKRAGSPEPPQPDGCDPANGTVVLIDEIDKADAEVPNGLLEALGAGQFTPPGFGAPVRPRSFQRTPLVIITTNEERSLPDAFLRRCFVLHLALPEDPAQLIEELVRVGAAHFGDAVEGDVLRLAATQVADDRARARRENWRPFPGQAEFLDLVRAVKTIAPNDPVQQAIELSRSAPFALHKHPEAFRAAQ